eukprot:GCRY01004748.1.p1 GENE.GCRY01004748.1~~GCRY01004748.1.p1  ORF type:complete len:389 (+),score=59.92 GCRY01004748.1:64-1230(+)
MKLLLSLFIWAVFLTACGGSPISSRLQASKNVIERGLVDMSITPKSIIREHGKTAVNITSSDRITLGYVTPWNSHGYDVARHFRSKFSHISPCWLSLQWEGDTVFIRGQHDIDDNWIADLIENDDGPRIVPRVLFEGFNYQQLKLFFENKRFAEKFVKDFSKEAKKHNFGGVVLDMGSVGFRHFHQGVVNVINYIGKKLSRRNLQLILVVPPLRGEFTPEVTAAGETVMKTASTHIPQPFHVDDLLEVGHYVTAFSVMSYDFSMLQQPGPNSPFWWLEENIRMLTILPQAHALRHKLLFGLNFYGYDFSPRGREALIGPNYIALLKKHKPKIEWDPVAQEHVFHYGAHTVYFPTLQSIHARLQLFEENGLGVSIWEIGQGLDYFYDLV